MRPDTAQNECFLAWPAGLYGPALGRCKSRRAFGAVAMPTGEQPLPMLDVNMQQTMVNCSESGTVFGGSPASNTVCVMADTRQRTVTSAPGGSVAAAQ
jgi:hypothetical protein